MSCCPLIWRALRIFNCSFAVALVKFWSKVLQTQHIISFTNFSTPKSHHRDNLSVLVNRTCLNMGLLPKYTMLIYCHLFSSATNKNFKFSVTTYLTIFFFLSLSLIIYIRFLNSILITKLFVIGLIIPGCCVRCRDYTEQIWNATPRDHPHCRWRSQSST